MRTQRVIALFLLVVAAPALASAPPADPSHAPEALYQYATNHLRAGLWYDRASRQLEAAAQAAPADARYHGALGCAYACEALNGASWIWRRDQERGPAISRAQVHALLKKSVEQEKEAMRLSPHSVDYPYTLAWIYLVDGGWTQTLGRTSDLTAASACFHTALKLAPKDPRIPTAMGDAVRDNAQMAEMFKDPQGVEKAMQSGKPPQPPATTKPTSAQPAPVVDLDKAEAQINRSIDIAIGFYLQAEKLSPQDAGVHYRLYSAYFARYNDSKAPPPANLEKALRELEQARAFSPQNALYGYLLANLDYQQAEVAEPSKAKHFRDLGLTALEAANDAGDLSFVAYQRPFPIYLRPILVKLLRPPDFDAFSALRSVARGASAQAGLLLQQQQPDGAIHADSEVIRLGERLIGDPEDLVGDAIIYKLVGSAIESIGLYNLDAICRQAGDAGGRDWVQKQKDRLTAMRQAIKTAVAQQAPPDDSAPASP